MVPQKTLSYPRAKNSTGNWVSPPIGGAAGAPAGVTNIPANLEFFIVNAPGDTAYPISGFSWIVVYQHQSDATKGEALANMLWWMTHAGQSYAMPLNYAPLPAPIVTAGEGQIKSMTCGSNHAACSTGIVS